MIKLSTMKLQNFLSHRLSTINFDSYEGLVLIEGKSSDGHYNSNGSGKSTLLEGTIYALTGDTLRGVSVNDVINRNAKKDTRVELTFLQDEDTYKVLRCRKDSELGDCLFLYKNDVDISKRVNKETQKLLDDTLGISYKVLLSTIFLGEGLSSKFTQLSDPDKKSLIESTLNLGTDMSFARDRSNKLMASMREVKSRLGGELDAIKRLADIDIDKVKNDIETTQILIADTVDSITSIKSSLALAQEDKSNAEKKIALLRGSLQQYDTITSEIGRLDHEGSLLVNQLTEIESSTSPKCTLCHQDLRTEDSMSTVREDYRVKITEKSNKVKELVDKLNTLPNRSLLEDKYKELLDSSKVHQSLVSTLSSSMSEKSERLGILKSTLAQYISTVKNVEENNQGIDDLNNRITDIDHEIDKYKYFYDLFSPTGIINNILQEAIDYINTRLSTYSSVLLDKSYSLTFIKGKIALVDAEGSSYQSLSNGEKRRLDISIQFSLHDYVHMYCGLKLNCCFIDEVLDTLDDVGVENIIDVLRLKLEYCQLDSVYLITHNTTLKNKFDRSIKVSKDASGDSYLINTY